MSNRKNFWNPKVFKKNAEKNILKVENTINDLKISYEKILVCGRGTKDHPSFSPRFSTTSTEIESDLYVLVDHTYESIFHITRKGNYALSLIVDPYIVQKINELEGTIYWFSPNYLQNNLPKITAGVFPRENSGLASIALASYYGAKNILLSGIKLDGKYVEFLEGKELVFKNVLNNGTKIFSIDGKLADKMSYENWIDNSN